MDNVIDVTGKPCPIPVITAKKALKSTNPGDSVKLLVDDEAACGNLKALAESSGYGFNCESVSKGNWLVTLTVVSKESDNRAAKPSDGGFVVTIGRRVMGAGDDTLGEALMKSYLHALTQLDTPPKAVLFFNGGVFLTAAGSSALEDIRALESKGTRIGSCGACVDFYQLDKKAQFGDITNMYAICSEMANAERLVNL